MLTTNLLTFLIKFSNTSESLIVNISFNSLYSLAAEIRKEKLIISEIMQLDLPSKKFKKISIKKFASIVDHHTELSLLIN